MKLSSLAHLMVVALIALFVCFDRPAAADSPLDLGTLAGGTYSEALGLNDLGQVVGVSDTTGGQAHAFLWTTTDGMQDLGTLGGEVSEANGINATGQVVGDATTAGGLQHAFLWTAAAGMQDLGTLGGAYSVALGINNAGQIVGYSYISGNATFHAFLWTAAGGMQDLGTLGGESSVAFGINNSEQVVGYFTTMDGQQQAFLWTAASGMQDLGTLGGDYSYAYGINNAGQVVGQATTAGGQWHAFFWTAAGGMQDMGTLGGTSSAAYCSNDAGQVAGWANTAGGQDHAFLWTAAGGMLDLGTLWGIGSGVYGINNVGQLVGYAWTPGGPCHACLWTVPPLTAVSLSPSLASPSAAGAAITLTTTATGGANDVYQFLAGTSVIQDYSSSNTCSWTPMTAETYSLTVNAKDLNGAAPMAVVSSPTVSYVITPPLTAVALAPSLTSPRAAGASIPLIATPTGGASVVYQFIAGSAVISDYSASTTCTWTPTDAGTYSLTVNAKDLQGADPTAVVTSPAVPYFIWAITQATVNLCVGQTQQFTTNATSGVTWYSTMNAIDANGLYTAPSETAIVTDTVAATVGGQTATATVTIQGGYEGDVNPRPNGDGTVGLADWVQEGRFAAGLDTPNPGSEFQRADCSPRATQGSGFPIGLADWVQVGRYAAGLDSPTPVGGPWVALTPETVTLGNLSQTYGSVVPVMATTSPDAGLAYSVTYNGSATEPTDVGSYTVTATITTPGYTGSANGTLVIAPE